MISSAPSTDVAGPAYENRSAAPGEPERTASGDFARVLGALKQRVTALAGAAETSTPSDQARMFNETGFFGRHVDLTAPPNDLAGRTDAAEFEARTALPTSREGPETASAERPVTVGADLSAHPDPPETRVRQWMTRTTPLHRMSNADASARSTLRGPQAISVIASPQPVTIELVGERADRAERADKTAILRRASQLPVRISLQKGPEGMIVAVRADGLSEEQRESLIEEARSLLEELGLSEAALVVNGRRAASDGQSQERN